MENINFGEAIEALKQGKKITRKNWNGKGLFLSLQEPTELSKMTRPYIYITAPAGNGGYTKEELVPWLASQSDILSNDWIIL